MARYLQLYSQAVAAVPPSCQQGATVNTVVQTSQLKYLVEEVWRKGKDKKRERKIPLQHGG